MKKFLLLDQTQEPMIELAYDTFSCGILELGGGLFVVNVVTHKDGHNYQAALYRDIEEAAQAVQALRDFAFAVTRENQAFAMPQASEPVSALEILDTIF